MIGRALTRARLRRVTADEVYGADPRLRADLERRQMSYVLAVATTHRVATGAGTCPAGTIRRGLPRRAWQRLSGRAAAPRATAGMTGPGRASTPGCRAVAGC